MLQNRDYRLKQENTDFVKQQLSAIEKPPKLSMFRGAILLSILNYHRKVTVSSSAFRLLWFGSGPVPSAA